MKSPIDQSELAVRLGERLRSIRSQQQLSLHDVERLSEGELKASVVGAYERGERTLSLPRLGRLAAFYRVHLSQLLDTDPNARVGAAEPEERVVVDLVALEEQREERVALGRFVDAIRSRRGDFNGRVLTVRTTDLLTLAAVLDMSAEGLREDLAAAGVLRTPGASDMRAGEPASL